MKAKVVLVSDKMQKNYRYLRTEPPGKNFAPDFKPELTPKEMLEIGVFGGRYMTDCRGEFPAAWFRRAKLFPRKHDPRMNSFGVNASHSLPVWKKGMDLQRWPARLVPVILPLLHGQAPAAGG